MAYEKRNRTILALQDIMFSDHPQSRHTWIPENDDGYLGEDVYLYTYTGLVMAIFFFTKARAISFFFYCMRISTRVHNKMFQSLVRAPIKFFDDNPSGSIL